MEPAFLGVVSGNRHATQSSSLGVTQSQVAGRWVCRLPLSHKRLLLSLSLQTLIERPVSYKQGRVTLSEPQCVHLEKRAEATWPTSMVAST